MRVLIGSEIFKKNLEASVVTIGNFDGVHRGHAALFSRLKAQSAKLGLPSVVVTFDPHPVSLISPQFSPPLITTYAQKSALIAAAGIDCLAVIEFTPDFSSISAESFVSDILCHSLGMRHIIIGHDYAFGRERQGNYETLVRMGSELGFSVEDLDPVGEGDAIFSSSLVRRMVAEGDVAAAAAILGRYHVIAGQVVHGRKIGRELGFPTANIETSNELIPCDGIYAVMVAVGDELYQGACQIGTNPTFGLGERTVEVFLLDYAGQLYGRELALCFVQRLRDVKTFPDSQALIRAIESDVTTTRTILALAEPDMVRPLFPTGEAA